MIIQNVDGIFALNLSTCMICMSFILITLFRAYRNLDLDTKLLFFMQTLVCLCYLVLEYRWIRDYVEGRIIIKDMDNLYWVVLEAMYFAVVTLLSIKIYKLQVK